MKEKSIQEFINEIEQRYNKSIFEFREEKDLLRKIINQARDETDVTIRELSKILKISKTTVNRYINNL